MRKHKEKCKNIGAKRVELLPEGENMINFEQIVKMMKLPFVIYADFETLNVKIDGTQPNHEQAYTEKRTIHEMSVFTYHIVLPYFENKTVTYRGEEAAKIFLEKILEERENCLNDI